MPNWRPIDTICGASNVGSIIDKFGADVQTEVVDAGHFKATVSVELSGVFFGWVIASMGTMIIIGPEDVVSEFQILLRLYLPNN